MSKEAIEDLQCRFPPALDLGVVGTELIDQTRVPFREWLAFILTVVPDQRRPPVWFQDAQELMPRIIMVEPVKGLCRRDEVNAGSRQRSVLRRAIHAEEVR